jgi:hypothetical protein
MKFNVSQPMSVGLSYHLSIHQPKGLLIGWPLRSNSVASGHLCGSQFWLATRRSFPVDNHDIRMKIKIEDRINKKDYHILGQKHFLATTLMLFLMAGHYLQPKCQSLPPKIRVKKLQRDTKNMIYIN